MASFGKVKQAPVVGPTNSGSYGKVPTTISQVFTASIPSPVVKSDKTEFLDLYEKQQFLHPIKTGDYGYITAKGIIDPSHELSRLDGVINHSKTVVVGAWIAGGSVMSAYLGEFEKCGDIDVFCVSWDTFKETKNKLLDNGYACNTTAMMDCLAKPTECKTLTFIPIIGHKNNWTKPVQLIKLVWYTTLYHVLESFDFTCVKFGYVGGNIYYHKQGEHDADNRDLVVSHSLYPVSLVHRIQKYANRGFTMRDGTIDDIKDLFELPQKNLVIQEAYSQPKPVVVQEVIDQNNLWTNPEYRRDYYFMTPRMLQQKWGSR